MFQTIRTAMIKYQIPPGPWLLLESFDESRASEAMLPTQLSFRLLFSPGCLLHHRTVTERLDVTDFPKIFGKSNLSFGLNTPQKARDSVSPSQQVSGDRASVFDSDM